MRYAVAMPRLNASAHELVCKLVYWGPAQAGTSTHLGWLANNAPAGAAGRLVHLAAETEHALLFEFLPLALGPAGALATRFHVYSVPGQVGGGTARQAVLRGADGVVFVADARPAQLTQNVASLAELRAAVRVLPPSVLVVNHGDAVDALAADELRATLGWTHGPVVSSCAARGEGVAEALRTAAREVLHFLGAGLESSRSKP